MKLELSEKLLVEEMFKGSIQKQKVPEASEFFLNKLTGDASTRRYYRVIANEHTYVICLDDPTDKGSNLFIKVHDILNKSSIKVPQIYDVDEQKGYILEEDLGDNTFLFHLGTSLDKFQHVEFYKKAIDMIIGMQTNLNAADLSSKINLQFDFEKYRSEINFSNETFLEYFLGFNISSESFIKIDEVFDIICKTLAKYNRVFTHRDFHSRNLMVKKDEIICIDFQDARMGIPQYDLVSLLEDAYIEIDDELKKELIEYYWQKMSSTISDQSKQDFYKLYDYMAIQRVYKAIGTFCFIYKRRGDIRYLKYISKCFERIRKISLNYKDLHPLIKNIGVMYYAS